MEEAGANLFGAAVLAAGLGKESTVLSNAHELSKLDLSYLVSAQQEVAVGRHSVSLRHSTQNSSSDESDEDEARVIGLPRLKKSYDQRDMFPVYAADQMAHYVTQADLHSDSKLDGDDVNYLLKGEMFLYYDTVGNYDDKASIKVLLTMQGEILLSAQMAKK